MAHSVEGITVDMLQYVSKFARETGVDSMA
jgi:hypothetical protein